MQSGVLFRRASGHDCPFCQFNDDDAKTGIQSVAKSLLKEWLDHPPKGFRWNRFMRRLRNHIIMRGNHFAFDLMDFEDACMRDDPIDFGQGERISRIGLATSDRNCTASVLSGITCFLLSNLLSMICFVFDYYSISAPMPRKRLATAGSCLGK